MNIKHFQFHLAEGLNHQRARKTSQRYQFHLSTVFAVLYSLMLFPTALLAQSRSPTDIPPTDIPPTELPPTRNANPLEGSQPPATGGNTGVSLSPTVENAVNQAIAFVIGALNSGSLTTATGAPIPDSTQEILLAVLTAQPNTFEPTTSAQEWIALTALISQSTSKDIQQNSPTALTNHIENALTSVSGGPSLNIASNLASNLLGLLACDKINPTACKVKPAKLLAAVAAYNAVIKASSEEFLRNPPVTLLAIRAILSDLVNAAIAADAELKN